MIDFELEQNYFNHYWYSTVLPPQVDSLLLVFVRLFDLGRTKINIKLLNAAYFIQIIKAL